PGKILHGRVGGRRRGSLEAVACLLVARSAYGDGARHARRRKWRPERRHAALPSALVVVVEVPEDVQADADVAPEDAVHPGLLRGGEAAAGGPGLGEIRRAGDQVERDAVGPGPAVLPLVEGCDDAGAGGDGPVVENGARFVVGDVGELEIPGRPRGRRIV